MSEMRQMQQPTISFDEVQRLLGKAHLDAYMMMRNAQSMIEQLEQKCAELQARVDALAKDQPPTG